MIAGSSVLSIYGAGSSTEDALAIYNGTDGSYPFRVKHNGGVLAPYANYQVPSGETDSSYGCVNVLNSAGTAKAQIFGDGTIQAYGDIYRNDAATASTRVAIRDTYLRLYNSPVSFDDFKISLENSGVAKFAGTVSSGSADYSGAYCYISATQIGCNQSSSDNRIVLYNTGNAEFKGTVTVGNLNIDVLPALDP